MSRFWRYWPSASGSSNDFIMVGGTSTPYVSAYAWDGTGYGTKYSNPSTAITSVAYSSNILKSNNCVFLGIGASPWIQAYAFDKTTGWGTKYSNPSTLSTSNMSCVYPTKEEDAIIGGRYNSSPYVIAYQWDLTTGFGTKYADPTTIPAAGVGSYGFSLTANNSLIFPGASNYLSKMTFNSTTGFGETISASTILSTSKPYVSNDNNFVFYRNSANSNKLACLNLVEDEIGSVFSTASDTTTITYPAQSPNNTSVVALLGTTPFVSGWPFDNTTGIGVKFSNPTELPLVAFGGYSNKTPSFSPDGKILTISSGATPWMHSYEWSETTGFGTRYSNPSVLPFASGSGMFTYWNK